MKTKLAKTLLCYGALALCGNAYADLLWSPDLSNGLPAAGFTVPTLSPPDYVAEATDTNSLTYFGVENKDYIRLHKMDAISRSIAAVDIISAENANPLSLISFDFLMKSEGVGAMTLAFFTGTSVSSTTRSMEMVLRQSGEGATTGIINTDADVTFQLDQSVSIQIYHNNTAKTVQYLIGDAVSSLQSGHYSVVMNGQQVLIDTFRGTQDGAGNGIGIRTMALAYYATNTGEILINDLAISSFSPIPEPSHVGAAFAVLALGGAILMRRRRIAKARV